MSSLNKKAYYEIKHRIVTLEMAPGSRIDEAELMEVLRMGRTPIRDALRRLAREDLVVIMPRRGMFVSEITITDLQHIFEARIPIEVSCARLATERANGATVAKLEQLAQRAMEACRAEDYAILPNLDEEFHETLAQASGNKFLADAIIWLYALSLRIWYLKVNQIADIVEIMQEQLVIVDALKRRDAAAAEAAIRKHLTGFQERVRAAL